MIWYWCAKGKRRSQEEDKGRENEFHLCLHAVCAVCAVGSMLGSLWTDTKIYLCFYSPGVILNYLKVGNTWMDAYGASQQDISTGTARRTAKPFPYLKSEIIGLPPNLIHSGLGTLCVGNNPQLEGRRRIKKMELPWKVYGCGHCTISAPFIYQCIFGHARNDHAGVTMALTKLLIVVISSSQTVYRVLSLNGKAPYASILHNEDITLSKSQGALVGSNLWSYSVLSTQHRGHGTNNSTIAIVGSVVRSTRPRAFRLRHRSI